MLFLPNPLKPGVKLRMKMYLEQRRQVILLRPDVLQQDMIWFFFILDGAYCGCTNIWYSTDLTVLTESGKVLFFIINFKLVAR